MERRRHPRYRLDESGSQAWFQDAPETLCSILDLSFGGLSMEVRGPLTSGLVRELHLDLRGPIVDSAVVTVAIRWSELVNKQWHCGAEFLKSNRPWLGPEEEG